MWMYHFSSTRSPLVPFLMRAPFLGQGLGPSRAEVGFGSRLVGYVRRFCPPPLLWLVFGPSSVRFFFSLALSGFARFGLGVLVLVFSPSLFLFAFPLLCSGQVIVISSSSSFHSHFSHFHLHLIRRGLKCPAAAGRVCGTSEQM